MSYATVDNLLAVIPQDTLIALTDDNDTGEFDQALVEAVLEAASTTIDGHLVAAGMPVDRENPQQELRAICLSLAGYQLHLRRDNISEAWAKQYEIALRRLDKIAPAAGNDSAASNHAGGASETLKVKAAPAIFSHGEMEKY